MRYDIYIYIYVIRRQRVKPFVLFSMFAQYIKLLRLLFLEKKNKYFILVEATLCVKIQY
jgi:hypothetical protein